MYRFFIFVTVVVLCKGADISDIDFRYDYEFNHVADGWFKLHYAPMNWQSAREQCFYEGAVLAAPVDQKQRIAITKFLQDQKSTFDFTYIGVSATFTPGVYTSVEGVPLEKMSINWSRNEPLLPDGCLVYYSNGTMGTTNCSNFHPFVCYRKFENMVINECGTVDNEYRRGYNTTNCFKYHAKLVDWSMAYKICQAEGAYLSTLSQQFIHSEEIIATGYRIIDNVWWDIHGNLMEPFREGGGKFSACGGRSRDGKFSAIYCKDTHHFVCEKTVDSLLPTVIQI